MPRLLNNQRDSQTEIQTDRQPARDPYSNKTRTEVILICRKTCRLRKICTDKQTERLRPTFGQTHKHINIRTDTQADIHTEGQTVIRSTLDIRLTKIHTDVKKDSHKDRQTDRSTDRHTSIRSYIQTYSRQTYIIRKVRHTDKRLI